MASATVAGVAALVKSYFPKLTGSQIRDILLKSVTSRKGVEVEKGIRVNDSPSQDLFLFDDLCISGGIVNAYQAILEAEKVSNKLAYEVYDSYDRNRCRLLHGGSCIRPTI